MYEQKLEVRCSGELIARIDGARGDASRSLFVRRAVEQALGGDVAVRSEQGPVKATPPGSVDPRGSDAPKRPAPAESPLRIPGVRRASSFVKDPGALARQERVNRGKGS